jgi:hypothetical protein
MKIAFAPAVAVSTGVASLFAEGFKIKVSARGKEIGLQKADVNYFWFIHCCFGSDLF